MSEELWDAVIVGAGVAGGFCASLLAERGWKILVVEKSSWPREKVCGGCVNAAGLQVLVDAGLGGVLRGSLPLTKFELVAGKERLELELPRGAAIRRRELDANLVAAAVERGATFISGTSATLLPTRSKEWRELRIGEGVVRTKAVLACDGIAGTLLENESWARWRVCPRSYFGVAGVLKTGARNPQPEVGKHSIGMHLGNGGYVGLARYQDEDVHVAAALSVKAAREIGGPVKLMERILNRNLAEMKVLGTPLLTRWRHAAGERVFAVGDACGYVEPFTGQGIAWALEAGREATKLLLEKGVPEGIEKVWDSSEQARKSRREGWIRVLREVIRHPKGVEMGMKILGMWPRSAGPLRVLAAHIGGSGNPFDRELA